MMPKTSSDTTTNSVSTTVPQHEYENDAIAYHDGGGDLENRDPYSDHVIFS